MADDPRYDAATAVTGAALLGGGGALRHHAVRRAYPKKGRQPKIHALSMLRKAPKGKKQFWTGSVIGALGLPPLALGTTRLARGDVDKMAPRIVYHGTSREAATAIRRSGRLAAGGSSTRNEVYVTPHRKIAAAYAGRRAARPNEASDWARGELNRRTAENGRGRVVRMWAVGPSSEPEHRGARAFAGSTYHPGQVHVASEKVLPSPRRANSDAGLPELPGELAKADDQRKPGFWREGLRGTKEALGQRADSYRQPVPTKLRAAQLGVGAAAGAVGSVVARAALGRRGDALKPFVTPIAGGLSATGSVPLTNRVVHNRYPDYEVTPSGVRRKKKPIVMPSKMASRHRGTPRSLRQDVNKAQAQAIVAKADQRYLGARTPYATQRAVTTASTHTPVVGPFVSAGTAARYAPPGQGRKAALRQWGMSSGVGIPAGIAGAYGGAHLANRSDKAHHAAQTLVHTKDKVEGKARSLVGLKDKEGKGRIGRAAERFAQTKAGKPFRTPKGAIGGAAGMIVARGIAGGVGDQAAITMNQNAQRRYNKLHHIEKLDAGQTKRERHNLATQKRRTAALSTASGLLGLGSLGLIAAGRRNAAVTSGIIGSGIGGTNSLLGARVQRKEAQAVDPVKKRYIKGTGHWDIPKDGLVQMVGSGGKWASGFKDRENPLLGVRYVDPEDVQDREWTRARLKAHTPFKPDRQKVRARTTNAKHVYRFRKAAPLEIKGSDRDHHEMIRRYGDRGPLPKGLSREDRMKAYEARYVHHGGDKANKWSRHAATGESLKNAGLGVATAGGAAWLATRGKRGARLLARRPNLARHAETTAVAGATVGGAGEMLAGYAHRRQSSYANSPGGVAASALRRMRAYTPETT